ncbi:MAG: polysaccharide deacetylase family protein, partial [Terriglobales bacterium]
VLVACPWFPEVARWAKEHPDADLGIHLALNSEWTGFRWGPVSRSTLVPTLLDAQGYLPLTSEEVMEKAAPSDVEQELRAQIEKARAFGVNFTHLDSHMGTLFRTSSLFDVYLRVGQAYRIPQLISQGSRTGTSSLGLVPAGGSLPESPTVDQVLEIRPGVPREKWVDTYKDMLRPLPPGVHQLILHTAYDDEEMRAATWDHPDWGAAWRQQDFDMVKSPEFQKFLRDEGFILVKWKDIGRALAAPSGQPSGGNTSMATNPKK